MAAVGLAHDYLLVMRGAERSFAEIAACWPEAPIHTTLYDAEGTERRFDGRDVRVSPLQRLGVRQRGFRRLLPLFPWAVGRLDVSEHSLVVSSSSAWAHGVRAAPGAVHVSYCYTPFRYAWHERETALAEAPRWLRPALARTLDRVRAWDLAAQARVTHHVAIGRITQERIAEVYGRESTIVHPPVEVDRFSPGAGEDFALIVGELTAHKRADVAIAGALLAGLPVKVVGDGPERERWQVRHPEAEFLGRRSDEELAALYQRARVHVVCAVEEFGITVVEAQAAGRPVVAPRRGGASETVLEGQTGVLLDRVDVDTVAAALRDTDFDRFDPAVARANAERFAPARFRERLRAEVERVVRENG